MVDIFLKFKGMLKLGGRQVLRMSADFEMGQVALLALIISINAGGISGLSMIDHFSSMIFIGYVCLNRQWQLLQCGVLFFILSLRHYSSSLPILSQVPAFGIMAMVVTSFLIIYPFKSARNWSAWARVGTINASMSMSIIAVSIISSIALIGWARWADNLGIAVKMAEGIQEYPKIFTIIILIPGFACLNALMEEVVYRGVLQHALSEGFKNKYLVIVLQGSAFASIHFSAGFPNGLVGYCLTILYGSVLGYLRQLTNGIMAPWLCHLAADLTIFYYMAGLVWEKAV